MRYLLSASFVLIMSLLSFRTVYDYTITGKIVDEKGNPCANVTVLVKGTSNATSSANDGSFSIVIKSTSKAILIVSWVGYETQEVKVNPNSAALTIKLKPASKNLQEVVVIGYGAQRKMDMTGTVPTVRGKASGISVYDQIQGYPNQTYGYVPPQDLDREGT